MLRNNLRLPLAGILLLMIPVIVLPEDEPYYMWTDDNGVLSFSQIEPKDVDAKAIVKPMPVGSPVVEESDGSELGISSSISITNQSLDTVPVDEAVNFDSTSNRLRPPKDGITEDSTGNTILWPATTSVNGGVATTW